MVMSLICQLMCSPVHVLHESPRLKHSFKNAKLVILRVWFSVETDEVSASKREGKPIFLLHTEQHLHGSMGTEILDGS